MCFFFGTSFTLICRSQWPRGLRRRSAAARILRSWVRIPPGAWMFVCCECYVLSGRGLCDELITRPEKSYRMWCVVVCDQENLKNEETMVRVGSQRHRKKKLPYHKSFKNTKIWAIKTLGLIVPTVKILTSPRIRKKIKYETRERDLLWLIYIWG